MVKLTYGKLAFAFVICFGASTAAEEMLCENGIVTVSASTDTYFPAMCTAADRALSFLESCDLRPPDPLTVSISDLQDQTCLGLFHCGEGQIDVLSPDGIDARRSSIGLFSALPTDRLFESVIVHEIAHAAMDNTPCPYQNCVTSSEYFAYSVQLSELSDAEREMVFPEADKNAPKKRVLRDQINAMILYMAPDIFIDKVWHHLMERGDVCTQLRGVQDGIIVFDVFHP
jgi:hypothetical protein